MQDWHVSVAETAELLAITEQAVRKNAMVGKYGDVRYVESAVGGGSAGKALRIPLAALPEEVQFLWAEKNGFASEQSATLEATEYDRSPAWRRQEADRKLYKIRAYEEYVRQPGKKVELGERFVAIWNAANPNDTVTLTSLYNWRKAYKDFGLDGLLPNWGKNKGQSFVISDYLRDEFIKLLKTGLKVAECHRVLQVLAKSRGEACPSDGTLHNILKSIPAPVLIAIKEGKKACVNKAQTFTRRDPESISAGQVFVGDHRRFDFHINGTGGKRHWVRPWVTAWLDMRSGKLVGWHISFSPNTHTIIAAFAEAALDPAIGLPRDIIIDNGRDYCSTIMAGTGHRGKREQQTALRETLETEKKKVIPMMERLSITSHFAIPENARAKTIERVAFKNMSDWFDQYIDTWCGRNSLEKPDDLNDRLKDERTVGMTIDELRRIFSAWARFIYNKRVSQKGKGREGECPDETFMRTRLPVRQAAEDVLQHYLMKQPGKYKIGRNGITFRGKEYYHQDIGLYKFRTVPISCREDDPEVIYVYDLDDKPLFKATALTATKAINETPERMHEEGSRKKAEWDAIKQHPAYQAAMSGKAISLDQVIELTKQYGDIAPDPTPSKVVEMVTVPELREAIQFVKSATGTDGPEIDPFEAMINSTIHKRKGGIKE